MNRPEPVRTDRHGRYRSLSNFYLADARRIASRERDLGLWWRAGARGPMYRAAWVRDTGELYVARLGPAQDGTGQVDVLGRARDRNELEQALKGWRAVCGRPDSITWLRERAAGLAQPDTPRALSQELSDLALTGRRLRQAKAAHTHLEGRSHRHRAHNPAVHRGAITDARHWRTTPPSTSREGAVASSPQQASAGRAEPPRRRVGARLLAAAAGLAAPAAALVLALVGG